MFFGVLQTKWEVVNAELNCIKVFGFHKKTPLGNLFLPDKKKKLPALLSVG